jgi:hypothetical protein
MVADLQNVARTAESERGTSSLLVLRMNIKLRGTRLPRATGI